MTVPRILLVVAAIASALGVVFVTYQNRVLYGDIHHLEAMADQQDIEWGKLKLEQSTLTEHNRIERLARLKLGLEAPEASSVVYLTKQ